MLVCIIRTSLTGAVVQKRAKGGDRLAVWVGVAKEEVVRAVADDVQEVLRVQDSWWRSFAIFKMHKP